MKKTKRKTYLLALLPFLILVGLFEILPILSIIVRSFMPQGGGNRYYLRKLYPDLYHEAVSVSDHKQFVYRRLFFCHRTCRSLSWG